MNTISVTKLLDLEYGVNYRNIPDYILEPKIQWGKLLHSISELVINDDWQFTNLPEAFFSIPPLYKKSEMQVQSALQKWIHHCIFLKQDLINSLHASNRFIEAEIQTNRVLGDINVRGIVDMRVNDEIWEIKTYAVMDKKTLEKTKLQMYAYKWLLGLQANVGKIIWAHWNKDKEFVIEIEEITYEGMEEKWMHLLNKYKKIIEMSENFN